MEQMKKVEEVLLVYHITVHSCIDRSSHDDAHPDNSTLHTGAVRPHTGFVGSLFFISSRTGHGSSQVLEMLPAFSYNS